MGVQSEITRENDVQLFCERLAKKIEQYPEAAKVLKEMGREMLDILPNVPVWADEFLKLFRE